MKKYTIILDAAHGEETPGKRSPDGTFREYKWSRDRIKDLKQLLEESGFEVFESNSTNREIGLSKRAANANKIKRTNKLFISIHSNASGNGTWELGRGYSVYTTKGKTKSDLIAEHIMNQFKIDFPELRPRVDKSDGDLDIEENFTVIAKTECPAVLVEWLFQDNKEDLKLLMNSDYNTKFVSSLLTTIKKLDETL